METLVSVRGVKKTFVRGSEKIEVLEGLDMSVAKGEFLALMGPSGSGKSTLLNLIGGLDRPTSGIVEVGGVRIDELSEGKLAAWRASHIGFVFQMYNLLPALTAERNVELPLLLTKLGSAAPQEERRHRTLRRRARRPHEALPAAALRRPGAARRHRARHRHRPDAPPLRRADRRPRQEERRRDPEPPAGA